MIKAVLFDIDGVLIDSLKGNRKFINDLLREQGKKGLNEKEFFEIRFMTVKNVIEKFVPELNPVEVEKTRKKWSEKYKNYAHLTKLNPGVKKILEELKGKIRLGVITNRTNINVLKYHKINQFFGCVVTALDVKKPKPSPEGVLKALKELKVKAKETIFIGDALSDIKAGKKAKVKMLVFRVKIKGEKVKRINEFKELKEFLGN